MKNTILFDLGNTLVQYYYKAEFPDILKQAITEVTDYLNGKGLFKVSSESVWQRVKEEDYEAKDHSVRPLEDRLIRIFQLDEVNISSQLIDSICGSFMKPIFTIAKVYDDVLPVLNELGNRKYRRVIVSNTPWGSPANLWREEIKRLGLANYIEESFFCRDAGWRKPAKQIFDFVLKKLQANAQECIFIGDDPRWDLAGPETVGMEAIIIDRKGERQKKIIKELYELLYESEFLAKKGSAEASPSQKREEFIWNNLSSKEKHDIYQ
jgi:putative hydrolase of the HAD superfamily